MILFWLLIALMCLLAVGFIAYPLLNNRLDQYGRGAKRTLIIIMGLIPLAALVSYLYWGHSQQLAAKYVQQQQANALRQQLGSPAQVIARLKQHLQAEPNSAQGWFLLGKLYFSQQQFAEAAEAYAQLNQLQPNNPEFLVQYAQALYFSNQHRLSPKIKTLLQHVLRLQANHPLAINLLAIDAYRQAHYQQAIHYWQQLLVQYPPNSDDYQAIATAIDNAQLALKREHHKIPLNKINVLVQLADSLKSRVDADDTVFIYARDATGSPMPLAITRSKVSELPKRVNLTEAMAMSPTKTLADATQVIVIARVSKSGQAMPQKGDLLGKSDVLAMDKTKNAAIKITIDSVMD